MHTTALFQRAKSVAQTTYKFVYDSFENNLLLEQFPRDIELLIIYCLEIPIIRLPNLSLRSSSSYLCKLMKSTVLCDEDVDNRPLYGLLHVGPPSNIIFLRDDLSPRVVNYVLAHEIGHFMSDVFGVRQLWEAAMPDKKIAIQQAFTWQDFDGYLELAAVIKGLPDRPNAITGRGKASTQVTTEREIQADLIARELLAPWEIVSKDFNANKQEMIPLLHQKFGLPSKIAIQYFDDLTRCLVDRPDFVDRLFGKILNGPFTHSSRKPKR